MDLAGPKARGHERGRLLRQGKARRASWPRKARQDVALPGRPLKRDFGVKARLASSKRCPWPLATAGPGAAARATEDEHGLRRRTALSAEPAAGEGAAVIRADGGNSRPGVRRGRLDDELRHSRAVGVSISKKGDARPHRRGRPGLSRGVLQLGPHRRQASSPRARELESRRRAGRLARAVFDRGQPPATAPKSAPRPSPDPVRARRRGVRPAGDLPRTRPLFGQQRQLLR